MKDTVKIAASDMDTLEHVYVCLKTSCIIHIKEKYHGNFGFVLVGCECLRSAATKFPRSAQNTLWYSIINRANARIFMATHKLEAKPNMKPVV